MGHEVDGGKIVANTALLYGRMVLVLGTSLYTSRVVLATLGAVDFGVYNAVAGAVLMFSILSGTLATAAQRFITIELGKTEDRDIGGVFSVAVTVQTVIVGLLFVLAETAGVWFLNSQLNIPASRVFAANIAYQCAMASFLTALVGVPFVAMIIAYERINAFAAIGVFDTGIKLAVAIIVSFVAADKLIVFSALMALGAICIQLAYIVYCGRAFKDCRFVLKWEWNVMKSMAHFAGWNFIGAGAYVLMTQGITLMLNVFGGVVASASRGVSEQVQFAVSGFVTNLMTAFRPQITKAFSAGDHGSMMNLVFVGSRVSFYLALLPAVILVFNADYIVELWLGSPPVLAAVFVKLTVVFILLESMSQTLSILMLACGRIRNYQIIVGGMQILAAPVVYMALKRGMPISTAFYVLIASSVIWTIARVWLLNGMVGLPVARFLREVVIRIAIVSGVSFVTPYLIARHFQSPLPRMLASSAGALVGYSLGIWFFGLQKVEKEWVWQRVAVLLTRAVRNLNMLRL